MPCRLLLSWHLMEQLINRSVPSIMPFCLTKIVSLVSELFKIKWEQKWKRTVAETAFYGLSGNAHCRGNRFDEEQEYPLSSEVTYRGLSEKLDIVNPHYLSHISQKSWWNDSFPLNLHRRTNDPQGRWKCSCIEMSTKMAACFLLRPFNYVRYSWAQMKI